MANVMGRMNFWHDDGDTIIYVESWRMLEYIKSKKMVKIVGTLENVASVAREYDLIFEKEGEYKSPESKQKTNEYSGIVKFFHWLTNGK